MANIKQRLILNLLTAKPIVFNPDLARITGSAKNGLFLSQLLYWSDKGQDENWIYKTIKEIEEETCLTRDEQDSAIKTLKTLKIIEVKLKGVPAKRHFHINEDKLIGLIDKYYSNNNN